MCDRLVTVMCNVTLFPFTKFKKREKKNRGEKNCYNLKLGLDCNLGKDLGKNREMINW